MKMMLQKKLPSKNRKTNKERLVDNHNSRKSLILRIAYSVSALPRLENTSAMIMTYYTSLLLMQAIKMHTLMTVAVVASSIRQLSVQYSG